MVAVWCPKIARAECTGTVGSSSARSPPTARRTCAGASALAGSWCVRPTWPTTPGSTPRAPTGCTTPGAFQNGTGHRPRQGVLHLRSGRTHCRMDVTLTAAPALSPGDRFSAACPSVDQGNSGHVWHVHLTCTHRRVRRASLQGKARQHKRRTLWWRTGCSLFPATVAPRSKQRVRVEKDRTIRQCLEKTGTGDLSHS